MIYTPRHFDANEWAVLGYFVLTTLIALWLPKRFPTSLSVIFLLWSIAVSRVFDHILAGPSMHDLYDIMDLNKIEWGDLLQYIMFAPSGYLFVYLYDRWKLKGLRVTFYVLGWSLLGTGIEWTLHLFHVYTYKEWKEGFSFCVYLAVQGLTLWLFEFLRKER